MRARQDRERRQPIRVLISDLPSEAGTPIVSNEVETAIAVSDPRHYIERIVDQSVHMVTGVIGRIGSSACGISPWFGATA
jgi:hypothetical protein